MKISQFFALLNLSLALFLAGCATPYQAEGLGGGYSDMALSPDIYRISFRGNNYASNEYVQRFLIRRCAEITLQKGYRYFLILTSNISLDHSVWTTPATIHSNAYGNYNANGIIANGGYWSNGNISQNTYTIINPSQTRITTRYTDSVIIKLLNSRKHHAYALDAAVISANFKQEN